MMVMQGGDGSDDGGENRRAGWQRRGGTVQCGGGFDKRVGVRKYHLEISPQIA